MPFAPEQRIQVAEHVLSRTLDGEAVLLDLGSGVYFGLDEVGTVVWERIASGPGNSTVSVAELRDHLLQLFEVDATTAARDLDELLSELLDRKLVRLVP